MRAEITREFVFEAAHHLPPVGPGHKCFGVHGHLFRVEVTVAGEVDPAMGWVMDFAELARAGREVLAALDHRVLNDVEGLGVPTSENLARWLFDGVAAHVPGVVSVTVHESPWSRCTYRPGSRPEAPIVIGTGGDSLVFSAAHFLVYGPGRRDTMHGHDYRVRVEVALAAPVAGADTAIQAAAAVAVGRLDHKLLIAGRPAEGAILREAGRVTLPGGALAFPEADCEVLDIANTSTEELAGVVARAVASDPAVVALRPLYVEAVVAEAAGASARARA